MHKLKRFLKRNLTPITIMLVPHTSCRPFSVKMPFMALVAILFLSGIGTVTLLKISVQTAEYYSMKSQLGYFSAQYEELQGTIESLKRSESEFRQLFALKSKRDVLEAVENEDMGSVDFEGLKDQIHSSVESVAEIKQFLAQQKDIYLATPQGWPVSGTITSGYGNREHPRYGKVMFHSGVDISAGKGTPVQVTADGVVSFAGWADRGGNVVVIEHGHGFSTAYAHNSKCAVRVGQRVKRGDTIAYSGSTGVSTGPHVHYEVWRNGASVNPSGFLKDRF
ncbi:MAG TPA: M23 family metallopeptidase [Geobacterales bacterium]|jgi:murein DD-endopeptidase MepM/ murein hydrolase activator NlpD|nr:M23 family metallopeptidase [Geobacterales bacterium]